MASPIEDVNLKEVDVADTTSPFVKITDIKTTDSGVAVSARSSEDILVLFIDGKAVMRQKNSVDFYFEVKGLSGGINIRVESADDGRIFDETTI